MAIAKVQRDAVHALKIKKKKLKIKSKAAAGNCSGFVVRVRAGNCFVGVVVARFVCALVLKKG